MAQGARMEITCAARNPTFIPRSAPNAASSPRSSSRPRARNRRSSSSQPPSRRPSARNSRFVMCRRNVSADVSQHDFAVEERARARDGTVDRWQVRCPLEMDLHRAGPVFGPSERCSDNRRRGIGVAFNRLAEMARFVELHELCRRFPERRLILPCNTEQRARERRVSETRFSHWNSLELIQISARAQHRGDSLLPTRCWNGGAQGTWRRLDVNGPCSCCLKSPQHRPGALPDSPDTVHLFV